jgi:hypothetical protein
VVAQGELCYDNDGVQLPCNQVTEANTRISKRNSREHWVFGRTVPQVEDGFALGDWKSMMGSQCGFPPSLTVQSPT